MQLAARTESCAHTHTQVLGQMRLVARLGRGTIGRQSFNIGEWVRRYEGNGVRPVDKEERQKQAEDRSIIRQLLDLES